MIDAALIAPERLRPLRRVEFDQLVELGLFQDERIELLRGALVQMSPQSPAHAQAVRTLNRIFSAGVGNRALVQVQAPLALSDDSEPEPDLALVPPGDYAKTHPTTALLVVEVAASSRRKDRIIKSEIYANAGVPEYWLVDLEARGIEVRSGPVGGEYRRLATYASGEVSPSAFPDIVVPVADLLP